MNNTGSLIKKLRINKGLTQQELADKFNLSCKTISRWETGEGLPDTNILFEVANFFGISVDELLKGETKNNETKKFDFKYALILLVPFFLLTVSIFAIFNEVFAFVAFLYSIILLIAAFVIYSVINRNLGIRTIFKSSIMFIRLFVIYILIGLVYIFLCGAIQIGIFNEPDLYFLTTFQMIMCIIVSSISLLLIYISIEIINKKLRSK